MTGNVMRDYILARKGTYVELHLSMDCHGAADDTLQGPML